MLDDDALDQLLFQARPDTPFRGRQLTGGQEATLRGITDSTEESPGERARSSKQLFERWPLAAALLVALMVIGTSFSVWPGPRSAAMAVTPKVLETQPLAGGAEELLMNLSRSIETADEGSPSSAIRFQFWALTFAPDEPPRSMQPQETRIEDLPDGRRSLETRALQPLGADGELTVDADAYDVNELVFQHIFEKGEAVGLFSKPSVDTEWGALLREGEGLPADANAAGYFRAVSNLLSEHALSRSEQSSLVRFLAALPNIQVEGQTIDRLGRHGVSFSAPDGDYRRMLIVSPELGVLAYETMYTGSQRTDIPSSAVIDYKAWYSPDSQGSVT